MRTLLLSLIIAASTCTVASAQLLLNVDLDRYISADSAISPDIGDWTYDNQYDDQEGDQSWVSGVTSSVLLAGGESIGVGEIHSDIQNGETTALIYVRGFGSGSAVSGQLDGNYSDIVDADGYADCPLQFRVARETAFIMDVTLWASGLYDEDWRWAEGRSRLTASNLVADPIDLEIYENQITMQYTGTLVPGQTYHIDLDATGGCTAYFNDDDDLSTQSYAAGGYEVTIRFSDAAVGVSDGALGGLVVGAHPSPASGNTSIRCSSPRQAPIAVAVYDLKGRRVRNWPAISPSGPALVWDGRNERGEVVAAGVYVLRARQGDEMSQKKIVRVR